jgi:hypothetical protein
MTESQHSQRLQILAPAAVAPLRAVDPARHDPRALRREPMFGVDDLKRAALRDQRKNIGR